MKYLSPVQLVLSPVYLVCLFGGSYWIKQKAPCDVTVATRDLPVNQLLTARDWTSSADVDLACPRTASKVSGRYLIAAISKGSRLESANISPRPRFNAPKGSGVFWIGVPDAINLEFIQPGSSFYLCADTCPVALMKTEAIRCGAAVQGAKRGCEVAVIVPESAIADVQLVMGEPYRFVIRE